MAFQQNSTNDLPITCEQYVKRDERLIKNTWQASQESMATLCHAIASFYDEALAEASTLEGTGKVDIQLYENKFFFKKIPYWVKSRHESVTREENVAGELESKLWGLRMAHPNFYYLSLEGGGVRTLLQQPNTSTPWLENRRFISVLWKDDGVITPLARFFTTTAGLEKAALDESVDYLQRRHDIFNALYEKKNHDTNW